MIERYVGTTLRASELDRALDRWWPAGGAGASALVVGPPGGGQRALLQALERDARASGIRVASVWVAPNRPRLMSTIALGEQLGAADLETEEPAMLARRLRRAFRSQTSPLLVLVQGLEEAPPEDAAILEDLLATPPEGRTLLVATAATRRGDGAPTAGLTSLMERVAYGGRCQVAELAALTLDEVAALLEADLGTGAASTRVVRDLAHYTSGRLDDLRDILSLIAALEARPRSELLSGSRAVDSLPAPDAVRARTVSALNALPEGARDEASAVATALAVWRFPAALATIEALVSLPAASVETAVMALDHANLVREAGSHDGDVGVQVADPLVGRVLRDEASPLARRRLHRAAAEVLEARLRAEGRLPDEELVAVARHALAGAMPMDGERAALVGSAARIMVARGRFAEARERLQSLDQLLGARTDGAALPGNLAALLAETLSRSGEWEAAQTVLSTPRGEAGAEGAEGAVRAEMRRARDRVALGQDREAWAIYEPVVRGDNPERDPSITLARVEAARVLQTLGHTQQAIDQTERAFREASDAGDLRVAARARISLHSILLTDGRPHAALAVNREGYSLARRARDRATIARVTSALGSTLADTHSLSRGIPWLRRAVRLAEACDDFPTVAWSSIRLANALGETGDLDAAERLSLRTMHLDGSLHRLRALPRSHALIRALDALRGRAPEGRPEVLQFWHGREALDQGYALNAEVIAYVAESLAAGDPRGAYEAVSTVARWFTDLTGRGRFLRCELLPWQVETARLMRDAGAADRAVEALRAQADGAEQFPLASAELDAAAGRAALAAGRNTEAIEHLEAAAASFGALGYAWRRARALRALAEAGIAAGEPDAALPALEEAHQFSANAGLAELKDIRALYARIGRRAPRLRSSSDLSEREREVARLAGRGMTDAEIGATLGIQRRTVTTHMHNILTKTGLRSRVELKGLAGIGE